MALQLVKSASPINVQPGEIVNYTVEITNIGPNDPETNIFFTDPIAAGASFVPDSFAIDNIPQQGADPTIGVSIPDIALNDTVTVTYDCLIDQQPAPVQITNTAQATSDDASGPFLSNSVTVNVEVVSFIKSVDKTLAVLGDTIIYTIIINNIGAVLLENPIFTDVVPTCTEFMQNSLAIDGIPQDGTDPNQGVPLSDINPGDVVTISFEVTVTCIPCPPKFVNIATLDFEIEREPGRTELKSIISNEVMTAAAGSTFKQLSREEFVKIPCQKPDAEQILNTLVDIVITDTKVINTIQGVSLEGQKLTGLKLIVEGILNQKVEYVADEPSQPVHAAHFRVPFSTFIVLPEGFDPATPIDVQGEVEDIFVELIDKRTIFKNITFRVFGTFA